MTGSLKILTVSVSQWTWLGRHMLCENFIISVHTITLLVYFAHGGKIYIFSGKLHYPFADSGNLITLWSFSWHELINRTSRLLNSIHFMNFSSAQNG